MVVSLYWRFINTRLGNWLWSLLPDKCEMPDCGRHGVRGNENRVDGKIMCDGCTSKRMN